MVPFGISRTIWQAQGVAADLAFVVVNDFYEFGAIGISGDARYGGFDSCGSMWLQFVCHRDRWLVVCRSKNLADSPSWSSVAAFTE